MKIRILFLSALVFVVFGSPDVAAMPIDLTDGWTAEGEGVWTVQPGGDSVLQSLNLRPTVFHNGTDSQGMMLSGTISVNTTADNDFVGFVLGYQAGDLFSPDPDYLVIDWRQSAQPLGGCISQAGLSVARVTGAIARAGDPSFFGNTACKDGMGVQELARGATLGNVGWNDFQEYAFDLIFTSDLVQVIVDGILEISLAGDFSDGAFGFYNSSQEQVLYAGITEDVAVIVSEPTTLALLGIGLVGFGFARRFIPDKPAVFLYPYSNIDRVASFVDFASAQRRR